MSRKSFLIRFACAWACNYFFFLPVVGLVAIPAVATFVFFTYRKRAELLPDDKWSYRLAPVGVALAGCILQTSVLFRSERTDIFANVIGFSSSRQSDYG